MQYFSNQSNFTIMRVVRSSPKWKSAASSRLNILDHPLPLDCPQPCTLTPAVPPRALPEFCAAVLSDCRAVLPGFGVAFISYLHHSHLWREKLLLALGDQDTKLVNTLHLKEMKLEFSLCVLCI